MNKKGVVKFKTRFWVAGSFKFSLSFKLNLKFIL